MTHRPPFPRPSLHGPLISFSFDSNSVLYLGAQAPAQLRGVQCDFSAPRWQLGTGRWEEERRENRGMDNKTEREMGWRCVCARAVLCGRCVCACAVLCGRCVCACRVVW